MNANRIGQMVGQQGAPRAQLTPPLKGSFPLDVDGVCKVEMLNYMMCMHESKQRNAPCRELAKTYFECRMSSGLMERDQLERLGYGDLVEVQKQRQEEYIKQQ